MRIIILTLVLALTACALVSQLNPVDTNPYHYIFSTIFDPWYLLEALGLPKDTIPGAWLFNITFVYWIIGILVGISLPRLIPSARKS